VISLLALAATEPLHASNVLQEAQQPPRPMLLSLPLIQGGVPLGDVLVEVAPDHSIRFESESLRRQLARVLNPSGLEQLAAAISGAQFVAASDLEARGIVLRYSPSRLEVLVEQIDTRLRTLQTIGERPVESAAPAEPPANFSAYLNLIVNAEYSNSASGFRPPDINIFGAARLGGFVLEVDGGLASSSFESYRPYRRAVRAVYDDWQHFRRFSAGDLRLQSMPLLGTHFIGGIAVEKSRRVFDPFQPLVQLGLDQILIDSPSMLEILVNGATAQTLELQPGIYNLADLPLRYGPNNVEVALRDAAGRRQIRSLQYFFDPGDLLPGEDEYMASVGVPAHQSGFQPQYGRNPVVAAYYRRGLSRDLAVGAAVYASQSHQVVAAQARIVPQFVPGSFDVQSAASFGGETGLALRAVYRWQDSNPTTGRSASVTVDYQSSHFRLPESPGSGSARLALSASYSQALARRARMTSGINYSRGSAGFPDQMNGYVDLLYQFSPRITATIGGEYGQGGVYPRNFGIRAAISIGFGNRHRADASYDSRRGVGQASFGRPAESHVGSIGYDVTVRDSESGTTADLNAAYVGNRFDARVSLFGGGRDIGDFGAARTARLQLGTSLAYAEGLFGVGRPITDSFLLISPHKALGDREVLAGRTLTGGRYEARSGTFGAAVVSQLGSYSPQNVLYDVDAQGPGMDIGSGIVHVDPPFRSGGVVTVGSDRFVNAVGNLQAEGAPVSLMTGTISSVDDEGFPAQAFFTNSAGRFAIPGLAPGRTYTVALRDGRSFKVSVPRDNQGLLRLSIISLPSAGE
jgi:outer membrane usher protein